ncbi:hypothetical protein F3J44_22200 [Pantoea sp. Tr-811]|nr:hypothetical protein [Pantoea sp. Tr-811]
MLSYRALRSKSESKSEFNPVGAGLTREASTAVHGTGCAGVRGASPLLHGIAARLRAMVPVRQRSPAGWQIAYKRLHNANHYHLQFVKNPYP